MKRTTIRLSDEFYERVKAKAKERGMSFHELVHLALIREINRKLVPPSEDPVYADKAVWTGPGPTDLAARHDHYLYGDEK